LDTLPKFNIAPEKDGWKTTFLLEWYIFRGYQPSFSGAMLNFQGVSFDALHVKPFGLGLLRIGGFQ